MAHYDAVALPDDATLAVTLDRYQELMNLPIAAFNGIHKNDEEPKYECNTIWTQSQRNLLAQFLLQAQEMREQELGYHITPRYIESERHAYKNPVILNWKHFIQAGVESSEVIEEDVSVTYGADPVELSVSTTVTDTGEIVVYHTDTTTPIKPSSISISGGIATIKIPKSRLAILSLLDDRDDHLDYSDDDNFVDTVDVYRVYHDASDQADLVWTPEQLTRLGITSFPNNVEQTQSAVVNVNGPRGYRIAALKIYPATYSAGSWTGKRLTYNCTPDFVDVNYQSGIRTNFNVLMTTIRLAHTLMPSAPCNCPYMDMYWKEDRSNDPSGLVTPYGSSRGAVAAWVMDSRAKIGMGGMF